MSKYILLVAIIMACFSINAHSDLLVDEGFEGGVFPPTGWEIWYEGFASWMYWELEGDSTDHWANCWINCHEDQWARATLNSPLFSLQAGQYCDVNFQYYSTYGFSPKNRATSTRTLYLKHYDTEVWSQLLTNSYWTDYSGTTSEVTESDNGYYFSWVAYVEVNPYSQLTSTLKIDDVLVNSNAGSSSYTETSLGTIKSTFR